MENQDEYNDRVSTHIRRQSILENINDLATVITRMLNSDSYLFKTGLFYCGDLDTDNKYDQIKAAAGIISSHTDLEEPAPRDVDGKSEMYVLGYDDGLDNLDKCEAYNNDPDYVSGWNVGKGVWRGPKV